MRKIYYSKGLKPQFENNCLKYDESLKELKRDLILFDQIAFPNLKNRLEWIQQNFPQLHTINTLQQIAEFDYLFEQGLIKDYNYDFETISRAVSEMSKDEKEQFISWMGFSEFQDEGLRQLSDAIHKDPIGENAENYQIYFWSLIYLKDNFYSLANTELIKKIDKFDVINSQLVGNLTSGQNSVNRHEAFKFTLEDLPFPSEMTPWQEILDYKKENDSLRRISTLRNWINKVIRDSYSENELIDEYEDFTRSFEKSIQLHKMKTNLARLEITVSVPLEIIEDVTKLNPIGFLKRATKAGFSIRKEQISLMEAEASAKGGEVAYQFFSKEKFS